MATPDVVLLDSGPLGLVSHPNAERINAEAVEWLDTLLSAGVSVLVADVILAAQAKDVESEGRGVTVATTNPRHLSRFVDAKAWQEIEP